MKKFLNNKGYTLIEIIISISIFSVLLVMITGVFINFTRVHSSIEKNNFVNSNMINVLNYIKYSVDETDFLQIVSEQDISKINKKNENYRYIILDKDKIVSGTLNKNNKSVILSSDKNNINLKFKKDINYPSNLIVELSIEGMNKPLTSYINIQNMQYNNKSIKGDNNVGIIYKKE